MIKQEFRMKITSTIGRWQLSEENKEVSLTHPLRLRAGTMELIPPELCGLFSFFFSSQFVNLREKNINALMIIEQRCNSHTPNQRCYSIKAASISSVEQQMSLTVPVCFKSFAKWNFVSLCLVRLLNLSESRILRQLWLSSFTAR